LVPSVTITKVCVYTTSCVSSLTNGPASYTATGGLLAGGRGITSPNTVGFGTEVQITATVSGGSGDVQFVDTGNPAVYGGTNSENLGNPVVPSGGTATIITELGYLDWNHLTAVYTATTSSNWNTGVSVDTSSSNNGNIIMSEFRPWGPGGADDTYLVLYNDSGSSISQSVPMAGWTITTYTGSITLPSNAPALADNQTYLLAGDEFSLTGVATPDDSVGAALDSTAAGVFGYELTAPDTPNTSSNADAPTVTDLVGTSNPSNPSNTFGDLTTLTEPGSESYQWAWTRSFKVGQPVNSGINASDFVLISNSSADVGSGSAEQAPALGEPAPQASTSPYQENVKIKQRLLQTRNTTPPISGCPAGWKPQDCRPNRIYVYGTPGTMVVQRQVYSASNYYLCGLQLRISNLSQVNGAPQPNVSTQPTRVADVLLMPPSYAGLNATTPANTPETNVFEWNPTNSTEYNLSADSPANTSGTGLDTTYTIPASAYPSTGLAPGSAITVSFTFQVDTTGYYWFGFNMLSYLPSLTPHTCAPA
jgi:hypothetical protein